MSDQQLVYIHRAGRSKGIENIKRAALQDPRLSFRARGVLAYLLSKPDDWQTNSQKIAADGKEGRDAIRTALAELEEAGYLARRRKHLGGGAWRWMWVCCDDPAELLEELAEAGLDGPDVAKPRPRTVRSKSPQPGNPVTAGQEVGPPHEEAMDGFSGGGKPGGGKPGDIESEIEKEPPLTPPQGGGEPNLADESLSGPGVCKHGRTSCRPCGTSARAQAWAARDAAAAEVEESEATGRRCHMCIPDGQRADGSTRWTRVEPGTKFPVSPFVACDHTTPLPVILAELAEAEAEAERRRAEMQAARERERQVYVEAARSRPRLPVRTAS